MPSKTEDATRSLAESINVATRSVHTKLNKLVISRLRLALPPEADDASQYVSGLLHVAPIYMTFESLWKALLQPSGPQGSRKSSRDSGIVWDSEGLQSDGSPQPTIISPRIQSLLTGLYFESLQRSRALQDDIISLTLWSKRTLAERLNDASESPVLSDFIVHTRKTVQDSPHTLVAYAWVLYMALFSGGRFIRASLENIYPAFWVPAAATGGRRPTPDTLASPAEAAAQPLSFFRFDTPTDGEDIKATFKARLLELEDTLTAGERDDVVREAGYIFEHMIRLVGELDEICGTDREVAEARLLSLRSRDSLVVENERRKNLAERMKKVAAANANVNAGSADGSGTSSRKEGGKGHVKFG